jgi:sulfotransferase famil protein
VRAVHRGVHACSNEYSHIADGRAAMKDLALGSLKRRFPVGSPLWMFYRSIRLGMKPVAAGHVLHSNVLMEDAKAIYVWVPKVACSTLKTVCATQLGYAALETDPRELAEAVHRRQFPFARKYEIRTRFASYYKFTFVRNPWDRLLSCYADKMRDGAKAYRSDSNSLVDFLKHERRYSSGMTFEAFVDEVVQIPDRRTEGHLRSQVSFLSDAAGVLPFDKIGRFETLADDFAEIAARLGHCGTLPHLRSTGVRDYRDYYSSRMRDRVRQRYAEDVERFCYAF